MTSLLITILLLFTSNLGFADVTYEVARSTSIHRRDANDRYVVIGRGLPEGTRIQVISMDEHFAQIRHSVFPCDQEQLVCFVQKADLRLCNLEGTGFEGLLSGLGSLLRGVNSPHPNACQALADARAAAASGAARAPALATQRPYVTTYRSQPLSENFLFDVSVTYNDRNRTRELIRNENAPVRYDARINGCQNYILPDGTYGPWGRAIVTALGGDQGNNHPYPMFTQEMFRDASEVCPNYHNFNRQERVNFWVWLMAAKAYGESKCQSRASNPNATNTTAVGLMQLEGPHHIRRQRGGPCVARNITDPVNNNLCSLHMLHDQLSPIGTKLVSINHLFQQPGQNITYWEVFNRYREPRASNTRRTRLMILDFALCQLPQGAAPNPVQSIVTPSAAPPRAPAARRPAAVAPMTPNPAPAAMAPPGTPRS